MERTVIRLAAEMAGAFETAIRPSSGEEFSKLKDDAPDWMTEICRKAHDDEDLLPDDWRYRFIEAALDALAGHEDADAARDGLEPDCYTGELTAWLHSLNSRVFYLGEVLEEYGPVKDGFQLLALAQLRERQETFDQVLAALSARIEEGGDD